jgi:mRNA-degrading endonuclease toxin of MazEF toxin-antitoxin module
MAIGEIWITKRAQGAGHVQQGVHPALVVVQSTQHLVSVVPITSVLAATRFRNSVVVEPSAANGLEQTSVLLIHQLGPLDKQFLLKKIGQLEPETFAEVKLQIRDLFS